MPSLHSIVASLSLFSATALAAASYPAKPAELTTPVQQRISVNGPNSRFHDAAHTMPTSQNEALIP